MAGLNRAGIHCWCYDSGLHVPMIIRWPKSYPAPSNYRPGSVKEEVVSLIDLTPTTLGFAGIEKPYGMHGRVFLGNQVGPKRTYAFSARDRVDETVNRVRSVRGEKYHYIPEIIIPIVTLPPSIDTRRNVSQSSHLCVN